MEEAGLGDPSTKMGAYSYKTPEGQTVMVEWNAGVGGMVSSVTFGSRLEKKNYGQKVPGEGFNGKLMSEQGLSILKQAYSQMKPSWQQGAPSSSDKTSPSKGFSSWQQSLQETTPKTPSFKKRQPATQGLGLSSPAAQGFVNWQSQDASRFKPTNQWNGNWQQQDLTQTPLGVSDWQQTSQVPTGFTTTTQDFSNTASLSSSQTSGTQNWQQGSLGNRKTTSGTQSNWQQAASQGLIPTPESVNNWLLATQSSSEKPVRLTKLPVVVVKKKKTQIRTRKPSRGNSRAPATSEKATDPHSYEWPGAQVSIINPNPALLGNTLQENRETNRIPTRPSGFTTRRPGFTQRPSNFNKRIPGATASALYGKKAPSDSTGTRIIVYENKDDDLFNKAGIFPRG